MKNTRMWILTLALAALHPAVAQDEVWKNENAPIEARVGDLLQRMTPEEKMGLLTATSHEIPRFGIAKYYHGNEALHGIIRPGRFTVFPQAIGMAAMWDPELLQVISSAISDEARARWNELEQGRLQTRQFTDLLTFWSPTVNMARDPRWGRTPETYGEDPFLTGVLGAAFVKGLQGNDARYLKVVSTPKHFACNNEEHNRFECNAEISEKQLREYYLPAYEACVKEGHAASAMGAYTSINGVPCCCNPWLLTKVLREDWGFDGYVVSDCGGVSLIKEGQKYVRDKETAATLALKAGLDLECGDDSYVDPLKKAYKLGMVTDEDIDRAAGRVLTARMRLGIFDSGEKNPYTKLEPSVVGCKKHQELSLEAARKSIVLLKNEGDFLPLNIHKVKSIAVVGNNAARCELGDYSGVPTVEPVSVLKAIRDKVGRKVRVNYAPWRSQMDETDFVDAKYFPGGIKVQYYDGQDFQNLRCERKESIVSYEPANKAPDPEVPEMNTSIRWTGNLKPDVTGEYAFRLKSNYSGQLWLDGKQLVKDGNGDEVKVNLQAGKEYALKVEYSHDRDFGPVVELRWKKPTTSQDYTAEAREAAKKSDVVVAVMGINKNYEREGRDRDYLTLPPDQIEFLKEIYQVNKKVVLVLVAGSSMAVNWEQENLPAIVDAWYGGEFGGTAIAEVLFGDYNPAGRLPLTFYKSMEQLPAFNDYDISKGRTYKYFKEEPLYPFGYGLSYTTYEYSALDVQKAAEGVKVNFKIRNTGKRAGDEVAQVYVRLKDYESEAPIKELKGFKRVSLKAGETQDVSILLPKEQLRYWSEKENKFKLTEDVPEIFVGSSSADIRLKK